jgi:hypothetical protein
MPIVRIIETTSAQWGVFTEMRRVLCATGAVSAPEQDPRESDARSHRAISGEPWPGASLGVRAPSPFETPLSLTEVMFGKMRGLL